MNEVIDKGYVSLGNKLGRTVWNIVYVFLFRPFGTKLFLPWRLLLLKLFGAKVYWDSGVYASTKIWAPWNLQLGHNAWLGPHVNCYNQAKVRLDDNVTVSQYCFICTAGHQTDVLNSINKGLIISPVTFKRDSWAGVQSYIGMGCNIGEGAIIGARAAVFKDVEPWTVVGGNPARFIKKRVLNDDK